MSKDFNKSKVENRHSKLKWLKQGHKRNLTIISQSEIVEREGEREREREREIQITAQRERYVDKFSEKEREKELKENHSSINLNSWEGRGSRERKHDRTER